MANQMNRKALFRLALSFLTIFPGGKISYLEGDLAQAGFFFPLVGLLLGLGNLIGWEMFLFLTRDPFFSSFLLLSLSIVLTRGLHLDGVADVCDAWMVESSRRREVLKDSRIGTFGLLGVLFFLGMKFFLISQIRNPWYLLWGPFLGRIGVLELAVFFLPLEKNRGLGKEFLGKVPLFFFLFWAFLGGGGMVFWGGGAHLLKIGFTFGIIYTLGKLLEKAFGGLNGDMLGMGIEVGEVITLFWGRFWP